MRSSAAMRQQTLLDAIWDRHISRKFVFGSAFHKMHEAGDKEKVTFLLKNSLLGHIWFWPFVQHLLPVRDEGPFAPRKVTTRTYNVNVSSTTVRNNSTLHLSEENLVLKNTKRNLERWIKADGFPPPSKKWRQPESDSQLRGIFLYSLCGVDMAVTPGLI